MEYQKRITYEKLKPFFDSFANEERKRNPAFERLSDAEALEAVALGVQAQGKYAPTVAHNLEIFLGCVRALRQLPRVEQYYLKAMNCPHHHRIFAAEPRSYRDLPLRLAEYGTNYRYEQSGELFASCACGRST